MKLQLNRQPQMFDKSSAMLRQLLVNKQNKQLLYLWLLNCYEALFDSVL